MRAGPRDGSAHGRGIATLALGALFAAASGSSSCTEDGREGPKVPPASPSIAPPLKPGGGAPLPGMTPNEVHVEAAEAARPVPWTRVEAVAGGHRLRVYATLGGGPPCTVLARVDVRESDDAIRVTLWAGRRAGARCDGPQPAAAFPVVVTVELQTALGRRAVADGAK